MRNRHESDASHLAEDTARGDICRIVMPILGDVIVREGLDRFVRRGQGRLLLHQDAINIVPSYEEAKIRHSQRI